MLHFHEEAREEYFRAVEYYADVSASLAERFISEVERALHEIIDYPLRYRVHRIYYRVKLLRKFKYSIFYRISGADIFVIAIHHHSQMPNQWIRRSR